MKYIFADSLDMVDPEYDFANDRHAPGRRPYWNDVYAHQLLSQPPYDGILVSRGIVGDQFLPGKYSHAQAMRFRRDGARKYLRLNTPAHQGKMIMGDSGAFTYANQTRPPFQVEDMVEFYQDGQFTHGCALDHIIFDHEMANPPLSEMAEHVAYRFQLTLDYAEQFLSICRNRHATFKPIGVVQAWSPESMGQAARALEKMGYDYLALGGMVPLRPEQIKECLKRVRQAISASTRIHLLGFAKADHIHEFTAFKIASFDSTSPLLRAFKDGERNYFLPKATRGLDYFSAIRIPLAIENTRLKNLVKQGRAKPEQLLRLERQALAKIRAYDREKTGMDETLEALLDYNRYLLYRPDTGATAIERQLTKLEAQLRRTLAARPWRQCSCDICQRWSVETIIFRSSNHNKRRGFHNLSAYYQHVQKVLNS